MVQQIMPKQGSTVVPPATRRSLKIFAFDPMRSRERITIDIPNEPIKPGPCGSRVQVIDYDGNLKCFYEPIDLNDRNLLLQNGLDPSETDPRFHQQMVYAVTMKVLENFDTALGRRMNFSRNKPLRIYPHAFYGTNAYYDPKQVAVMFGYFRADFENPGPNLPGQNVFTCLSHDVIAHEVTHALVDRLRRFFMQPTNIDVPAFHEAFGDIVAIFQHFSFQEFLKEHVRKSKADLKTSLPLISLAEQFGYATGMNNALRSAIKNPDPIDYQQNAIEPHERGAVLVAAIFDGFFTTYEKSINDLLLVATGGTGVLPDGNLQPDLATMLAKQASKTAQTVLSMCIRAFDYLPPVDITFGDFLRALITADVELSSQDEFGMRTAMIEAFRKRGIYPQGAFSLAEESLIWDKAPKMPRLRVEGALAQMVIRQAAEWSRSTAMDRLLKEISDEPDSDELDHAKEEIYGDDESAELQGELAIQLHGYASANTEELRLDPNVPIQVIGFHPVFRVAPHGQLLIELVAQFVQQKDDEGYPGLKIYGGTTIVASADGKIRYVISKSLYSASERDSLTMPARENLKISSRKELLRMLDDIDPIGAWTGENDAQRLQRRFSFKSMHEDLG